MKIYYYCAHGPYVGCDVHGVVEAMDEGDACDIVYGIAADNYHMYDHDDDDVEIEYDYYVEEYDPEKHDMHLYESDIEFARECLNTPDPHQA